MSSRFHTYNCIKPYSLEHLHRPEHSVLQPHFVSCWQLSAIGASFVQKICQLSPFFIHPNSLRFSISKLQLTDWPQIHPAMYIALFVCSTRAPRVGGIESYDLCFLAKRSSLASLIFDVGLDLSYITMTNISKISWSNWLNSGGYLLSLQNTEVTSGHIFQVCQAVFLPLPLNAETTTQPVNAWKKMGVLKPSHYQESYWSRAQESIFGSCPVQIQSRVSSALNDEGKKTHWPL